MTADKFLETLRTSASSVDYEKSIFDTASDELACSR